MTSAAHIEKFDPDFVEGPGPATTPTDDAGHERAPARPTEAARRLAARHAIGSSCSSCWCPPPMSSSRRSDGDTDRYDAELRPELMRRAIEEIQNGRNRGRRVEDRGRRRPVAMPRCSRSRPGRCPATRESRASLLGRGASTEQGRSVARSRPRRVDGFVGFAIGRSIWWDALKAASSRDELARETAASQIAENYLHFVRVYEQQAVH